MAVVGPAIAAFSGFVSSAVSAAGAWLGRVANVVEIGEQRAPSM